MRWQASADWGAGNNGARTASGRQPNTVRLDEPDVICAVLGCGVAELLLPTPAAGEQATAVGEALAVTPRPRGGRSQIPAAHLRSGGVGTVAALSPANVWAVGTGPGVATGGFSAHPTAVIEHFNGTSWSVVPSPNPNPQGNNGLVAVAAVSASDVWAVGHQLQGPFTEHWNGTSWSMVATPAGIRFFGAMAASSGGTVLAVGQGTNQSGIILSN